MKNLLIYCGNGFDKETEKLAKVQIDNSLAFGWEDITLLTSFPYSYNGVTAIEIPNLIYKPDPTNKIPAIVYALKEGIITGDTWYHDFDAYQNAPIEVSFDGLGLVSYGYKPQWNAGSFFFNPSARERIERWNAAITPRNRADEKCLTDMTRRGEIEYTELNVTYNYTQAFPKGAELPHRVLHFHPHQTYHRADRSNLERFWPIMSETLRNTFTYHGV